MNPKKEAFRKAFIASVPILCSYLFLGMAYGILMQEAGFGWAASLLTSAVVYTGAFQFVLITFLSSGASILTIAVTALFMNSRQSFYALTFLNDFKAMGKRRPYMIHSLTDETYAVNCTLESLPPAERRETMFYLAVLSHFYWTAASVLGGMLGQIIDTFVNSVYVFDDRVVLNFNFTDDAKTVTREEVLGSSAVDNAPPKQEPLT